jgi:hypothetical protein
VEFVGEGDDFWDFAGREYECACEDGIRLGKGAECEGGYDAEVCAGAAKGPEEVGVEGAGAG